MAYGRGGAEPWLSSENAKFVPFVVARDNAAGLTPSATGGRDPVAPLIALTGTLDNLHSSSFQILTHVPPGIPQKAHVVAADLTG